MPTTEDDSPQLAEINRRLGVIIALLVRRPPKVNDQLALREQITLLAELGMRPRDIAEVLGRTQSHVSKELAISRGRKARAAKRD